MAFIWILIYVFAAITLAVHFSYRNAVWGSSTLGAIVGLLLAIFMQGFDWSLIFKSIAIAAITGTFIEWIPTLLMKMNKSYSKNAQDDASEEVDLIVNELNEEFRRKEEQIQKLREQIAHEEIFGDDGS